MHSCLVMTINAEKRRVDTKALSRTAALSWLFMPNLKPNYLPDQGHVIAYPSPGTNVTSNLAEASPFSGYNRARHITMTLEDCITSKGMTFPAADVVLTSRIARPKFLVFQRHAEKNLKLVYFLR